VIDVILVGGGHSNIEVLRQFAINPQPDVRLTLISRGAQSPYSGMLPGLIAGHYTYDDAHIDLQRLARGAGARACFDEVIGVDPVRRVVHCARNPPIPYDLLSINIGSTPNASVPGAAEHAVPVKPIDGFLAHWDALRRRLAAGPDRRIAVVGGGTGGVELLLSIQFAVGRHEFHLFSGAPTILPTHNQRVRRKFERILEQRGVRVHASSPIVRVTRGGVHTERWLYEVNEILWTTQARAASWLREAGLATDDDGFVRVNDALQSVSHPEVFAAGDVAAVTGYRLEKSGVYAVREGRVLAENLRRAAAGRAMTHYRPQRRFLSLITTGDKYAVASRGPLAFEGEWVWRLKDRIDRRFMRKYQSLSTKALTNPVLAIALVALLASSCASATGGPRVMNISDIRAQPVARGDWIDSYDVALASIAALMKDDLGLPEVRASLYFHRDRTAFRLALETEGYTADAARVTADTLTAVGGFRRVLINEGALLDVPWPIRIALIAHELTHTVQYEWAGGARGTSDQWLREGFAEWVEVQSLTRLGFTTPSRARATAMGRIRDVGGARAFPPLSQMVTFPQWVALAQRFEQEAFYGHAWLATEFLIERHGIAKVMSYFELFAESADRLANFRKAFGEDLSQFEAAASAFLTR
jgi:pyridine nucleotide-disulfide oxidoreductase family protein